MTLQTLLVCGGAIFVVLCLSLGSNTALGEEAVQLNEAEANKDDEVDREKVILPTSFLKGRKRVLAEVTGVAGRNLHHSKGHHHKHHKYSEGDDDDNEEGEEENENEHEMPRQKGKGHHYKHSNHIKGENDDENDYDSDSLRLKNHLNWLVYNRIRNQLMDIYEHYFLPCTSHSDCEVLNLEGTRGYCVTPIKKKKKHGICLWAVGPEKDDKTKPTDQNDSSDESTASSTVDKLSDDHGNSNVDEQTHTNNDGAASNDMADTEKNTEERIYQFVAPPTYTPARPPLHNGNGEEGDLCIGHKDCKGTDHWVNGRGFRCIREDVPAPYHGRCHWIDEDVEINLGDAIAVA